jgi:hypothetical protein
MTTETDIERAAEHTLARVDLADLPTDYGYHSLPLCVIDAVYSLNAHYSGVVNVVRRYCAHAGITEDWPEDPQRPAPREAQHPVSALLAHMRAVGPEAFTQAVFQNLQRTSTHSGILKGEAVYQFAQALERRRIEHVQDLPAVIEGSSLEEAVFRIPGQNSGVSLRYFQMLAGSDDFIKPDRMILRFLADALRRPVTPREAQEILTAVSARLKPDFPALTPRLLDNRIWQYQRSRSG